MADIGAFLLAILGHWRPLATGVAALMVALVVGYFWEQHPPLSVSVSIVIVSIFIASFMAWREMKRERDGRQKELELLNTPSVSIALHKIDEGLSNTQTLFLEVTGVGVEYVRPEVFVMSVEAIGKGPMPLSCAPGPAMPFGIRRGEPHNVVAVIYDPKQSCPLRVELPCKKITSNEYPQGEYYKMKVCAFAGPKEAKFDFEFGMEGNALWARNVGSSERLFSDIRNIARKWTNNRHLPT